MVNICEIILNWGQQLKCCLRFFFFIFNSGDQHSWRCHYFLISISNSRSHFARLSGTACAYLVEKIWMKLF